MPYLTQSDFVTRSQKIHGDKYNYSKSDYLHGRSKVAIICPAHGQFKQTPNAHIQGQGCPACGRTRTASAHHYQTQDFLTLAKSIHGNKYDYSKVCYNGSKQLIIIICPAHGQFEQSPDQHLSGSGCKECGKQITAAKTRYSNEEFITRARAVHGDKFDYSLVEYVSRNSKVTIICPAHGQFEQVAKSHLLSHYGCPKCGYGQSGKNQRLTTKSFIDKAQQQHGEFYDYSKAVYTASAEKVEIACPQHGSFWQVAATHLGGHGCPACRTVKLRQLVALDWVERAKGQLCTLYFLRLFTAEESFYKVGITYRDLEERYRGSNSLGGYQYEIVALYKSTNAQAIYDWEQSILETFAHLRYIPKLRFGGESECFAECESILACFPL